MVELPARCDSFVVNNFEGWCVTEPEIHRQHEVLRFRLNGGSKRKFPSLPDAKRLSREF